MFSMEITREQSFGRRDFTRIILRRRHRRIIVCR